MQPVFHDDIQFSESDDEDYPCLKKEVVPPQRETPEIEVRPVEGSAPITNRQQRRSQRRQNVAPVNTEGRKRGRRRRQKTSSSQSAQSFDSSEDGGMLTVIEYVKSVIHLVSAMESIFT